MMLDRAALLELARFLAELDCAAWSEEQEQQRYARTLREAMPQDSSDESADPSTAR